VVRFHACSIMARSPAAETIGRSRSKQALTLIIGYPKGETRKRGKTKGFAHFVFPLFHFRFSDYRSAGADTSGADTPAAPATWVSPGARRTLKSRESASGGDAFPLVLVGLVGRTGETAVRGEVALLLFPRLRQQPFLRPAGLDVVLPDHQLPPGHQEVLDV